MPCEKKTQKKRKKEKAQKQESPQPEEVKVDPPAVLLPAEKRQRLNQWSGAAVCLMLVLCCVAWILKDAVAAHVPATCLGLFAACAVANGALFPSFSLLLVLPFVSVLPLHSVAVSAALGAALGEMTGYYLGSCGSAVLEREPVKRVQAVFSEHEMFWVFLFCILPLPVFDVIGILAGSVKMHPLRFYFSCFAGKFLKMLAAGSLAGELMLLFV